MLLLGAVSAVAQEVAIAVGVRGEVMLQNKRIRSTQRLSNGDVLSVTEGSSLSVVVNGSNTKFRVKGDCKVRVSKSGVAKVSGSGNVTRAGAVNTAFWDVARGSVGTILGRVERASGDVEYGLYNPLPSGAIDPTEMVELTWKCTFSETPGNFILTVHDQLDDSIVYSNDKVASTARSLKLPFDKLEPGVWYEWRIRVKDGSERASYVQSVFRIMTKEENEKLRTLEQEFRTNNSGKTQLMLAKHYETIGHFDKALETYEAYLKTNPNDPTAVKSKEVLAKFIEDANKKLEGKDN